MILNGSEHFYGVINYLHSHPLNNHFSHKQALTDESGNAVGCLYSDIRAECEITQKETIDTEHSFTVNSSVSWNSKRSELILKREFPGLTSIFYIQQKERIFFASSLTLLLEETQHIQKRFNLTSLVDLAVFGQVISPQTIYHDVHSLPAGTTLTCQYDANLQLAYKEDYALSETDIKSLVYGGFQVGEATDYCSPFVQKNKGTHSEFIAEMAHPSNVTLFQELPTTVGKLSEPLGDNGLVIFAQLLSKRQHKHYWNSSSDLITQTSFLAQRFEYFLSFIRPEYQATFTGYWEQLKANKTQQFVKSSHVNIPFMSEDSLFSLCVVGPERLRHKKQLFNDQHIDFFWHENLFTLEQIQGSNVNAPYTTYLYSDDTYEACNLFSQFCLLQYTQELLGGIKITDIFTLKPSKLRRILNTTTIEQHCALERLICGVVTSKFLWTFQK